MAKNFNRPNTKKVQTSKIKPPPFNKESLHSTLVKFSFKYLKSDKAPYFIKDKNTNYFLKLLERITQISSMTCAALKYPTQKALRNHFIDWNDTTQEGFGLPDEEQLVEKPFQFGISANEHGRVIGFFIDNTFYVVWLDPDHNTYS